MLVRLSVPGVGEHGGVVPDPVYGDQLQEQAILGVPREGRTRVTYTERTGTYADGEAFTLRVPAYAESRSSATARSRTASSSRRGPRRPSRGWGCSRRSPRRR